MKTFTLALPLALASLSLAQFQGLPTCATDCATGFLNNGIGNCGRDVACICADKDFIGAISCCLIGACGADDQQKAIDFAQQLCQAQQVSVPNTVACASTSTTPGAASTSAAAGPTTSSTDGVGTVTSTHGAVTTTQKNSQSTTTAPSTSSSSGPATVKTTGSSTSSSNASSSSSSTPAKAAGARQTAAPVLGALGGLVAFAALL